MVRVILVGCGFMGRMHSLVYDLLPNAEVVAVADIELDRAQRFGVDLGVPAFSSLTDAISLMEADVVDICLPTYLHRDSTIEALRAGFHVLCEKPMALNPSDCDDMMRVSEETGQRLMVAHCIRYWPEYAELKRLVNTGELGALKSLSLLRYGEFPHWSWQNWLGNPELSGGAAVDMHIHDTDFALYLLGEPLEMRSSVVLDEHGPSHIFTTMRYPNEVIVHSEGGWNMPKGTQFKMAFRAVFENGAAIMDGGPLTILRNDRIPEEFAVESMPTKGGGNINDLGGYYHQIKDFVNCIESGRPFEVTTPESARLSLNFVRRELEAAKQRSLA